MHRKSFKILFLSFITLFYFSWIPWAVSSQFNENFSDGNFTSNPTWIVQHSPRVPGTVTIVNNTARFYRSGAGGWGGGEFLKTDTSIDIDSNSTLSFAAKAVSRSVRSGCGDSCTEHPVNIQLFLEDNLGNEYIARYSVNYNNAVEDVTSGNFKQVAFSAQQNIWEKKLTYKISDLWPAATKITSIWMFGAGWDFDGYVDNIEINNEVSPPQTLNPKIYGLFIAVDYSDWDSLTKIFSDGPDGKKWANEIYDAISKIDGWSGMSRSESVLVFSEYSSDNNHQEVPKIEERVQSILSKMKKGDQFVFTFTGHGYNRSNSGALETIFYKNGKATNNIYDEALTLSWTSDWSAFQTKLYDDKLKELFSSDFASSINKLFVLDACFSSGFMGNRLDEKDEGDLAMLDKVAVISAVDNEDAYGHFNDFGTPYFSKVLVKCIKKNQSIALEDLRGCLSSKYNYDEFIGEQTYPLNTIPHNPYIFTEEMISPFIEYSDDYESFSRSFPWTMFMPAIEQ